MRAGGGSTRGKRGASKAPARGQQGGLAKGEQGASEGGPLANFACICMLGSYGALALSELYMHFGPTYINNWQLWM